MLTIATLLSSVATAADVISSNSMMRPYEDHDLLGARVITNWAAGGDAAIKKHFIRLTTDRQSKRGWIMNSENVARSDWVATLHFRVSGQGDRLFGDGMALWFIDDAAAALSSPGSTPILGGPSQFRGFGILLDTFKNAGASVHKDVSVVVNDGTKEQHEWTGLALKGCDADFRYHEKRDDFDASKSFSALRVSFKAGSGTAEPVRAGHVRVDIDKRGTGEWESCVAEFDLTEDMPFLSKKWSTSARFGLSAATGGLADNHDVISFQLEPWTPANAAGVGPHDKDMEDEKIDLIEKSMPEELILLMKDYQKKVTKQLDAMQISFEHKMEKMEESMTNTIKKMSESEQKLLDEVRALQLQQKKLATSSGGGTGYGSKGDAVPPPDLWSSSTDAAATAARSSSSSSSSSSGDGGGGMGWMMKFFCILILAGLGFAAWKMKLCGGGKSSKYAHLG